MTITTASADYSFLNGTPEPTAAKNNDQLGQEEFLKLMVTQLENQDPTKPMDSFEFLSQISQFSTVDGIQDLGKTFGSFSDQFFSSMTLDAANMVGKTAIVASSEAPLAKGGEVPVSINVPADVPGIDITVQDGVGTVVRQMTLPATQAGMLDFSWDGKDQQGEDLESGTYNLSASYGLGEAAQPMAIYVHQEVKTVLFDQQGSGLVLSLADGREIGMSDVLGFQQ